MLKKLTFLTAVAAFAISTTVAFAGSKPTIVEIKDVESDSVTLKVSYPDYKDKEMDFKVRIKNRDTKKVTTKAYTKELDDEGETEITIEGLDNDTRYAFKVKAKKHSSKKSYSDYSTELTKRTDE